MMQVKMMMNEFTDLLYRNQRMFCQNQQFATLKNKAAALGRSGKCQRCGRLRRTSLVDEMRIVFAMKKKLFMAAQYIEQTHRTLSVLRAVVFPHFSPHLICFFHHPPSCSVSLCSFLFSLLPSHFSSSSLSGVQETLRRGRGLQEASVPVRRQAAEQRTRFHQRLEPHL